MDPIYPWQRHAWRSLKQQDAQGRLGHAMLCVGVCGSGLSEFAAAVAAWVLCREASAPCGQCQDCQRAASRQHQELWIVQPETDARQIKATQIRELLRFLQMKSFSGRRKTVLIDPADTMSLAAASSLLKTLEEPPGSALFILVSHRPHQLPVALRSRCQLVPVPVRTNEDVRVWLRGRTKLDDTRLDALLALASGAPLRALALCDTAQWAKQLQYGVWCLDLLRRRVTPCAVACQWQEAGAEQAVSWVLCLLQTLVRSKLAQAPLPIWLGDSREGLQQHLKRLQLSALSECHDEVLEARRMLLSTANFNVLGVLEDMALSFQDKLRLSH